MQNNTSIPTKFSEEANPESAYIHIFWLRFLCKVTTGNCYQNQPSTEYYNRWSGWWSYAKQTPKFLKVFKTGFIPSNTRNTIAIISFMIFGSLIKSYVAHCHFISVNKREFTKKKNTYKNKVKWQYSYFTSSLYVKLKLAIELRDTFCSIAGNKRNNHCR